MKKRLVSALTALLLISSTLAGCGSKEDVPAQTEQENAAQSEKADGGESAGAESTEEDTGAEDSGSEKIAGEPVTLRFSWWGSDPRHEATLKAIERYTELHPNVTIEGEYQGYDGYQQKLMTQIAGKTEPDLIQLDYVWFPDLSADSGIFVDLGEDENIDLSVYSEELLEDYCSIDGRVIALPMGLNGFGIMINKSFFEKHSIPTDTEWTWEKVIEEGRRIHEENPNDYLFAIESGTSSGGIGPFVMGAYIYSATGKYWADDETYTVQVSKEELTKAFEILKELFDSGAAQPLGEASLFTGQMEQNPKWLNGEMGFTIDWSAAVDKYKSAIGEENFTVGKPPFAENGDNHAIRTKPSMVLAVSNRSEHADVAADFANWMMNAVEAVEILGTQRSVPCSGSAFEVLQSADAIDADVAAMCEFTNASPAPPTPAIESNNEVSDIVKDICEQVVYGTLTPEEAADKFLEDVQSKLDTLKASE